MARRRGPSSGSQSGQASSGAPKSRRANANPGCQNGVDDENDLSDNADVADEDEAACPETLQL